MSDTSPMMQQYQSIKTHFNDALLFFRLGDFYEMFNSDAHEASRVLGLTLTQRQGVPMCGIPYHAAQTYIQRLLALGKKIAICEQTQMNKKGIAEREVVQVITPGTLMDEEYLGSKGNNFLLSLSSPKEKQLFYALCDFSTGELELGKAEPGHEKELLSALLSKWQIKEILVQESLLRENPGYLSMLENSENYLLNRFGDWIYDTKTAYEKLCRTLELANLKSYGFTEDLQNLHPVCAVLNYGEETLRRPLVQLRDIHFAGQQSIVQLDETSIRNLELVQSLQNDNSSTLLHIMNRTKTAQGNRLMRRYLLEPLLDKTEIEKRLDNVDFLYHHQIELSKLRDTLAKIVDIERIANRIITDKAHPKDIQSLLQSTLYSLKIIKDYSSNLHIEKNLGFEALSFEDFEDLIRKELEKLSDDPPVLVADGGIFRPGADSEIDNLRSIQEHSENLLETYLNEERNRTGITNLKIKYNRILGYFIEISKSQLSAVPDHFKRRQSLVNGERFTTDTLIELETKILGASEECLEREKELFLTLRDHLKSYADYFLKIAFWIGSLDVFASFAYVATSRGYTRPKMVDSCSLEIKNGRHPVVEEFLGFGNFIPNDCLLEELDKSGQTALITGPNMAGKSTYLRQQALITLLAHAGSFVPAEKAVIGLCDRIFCRVGASDNLARGESTFLVEMNEAAFILRRASKQSLIIMDEVGRGTSTQDGLSIAQAILEYLVNTIRARCLFATHFHELSEGSGFINLSMQVEEQNGTVHFLKKIIQGPSNNSHGIHVAALAGIPEEIICRAKELLQSLEQRNPGLAQTLPKKNPELPKTKTSQTELFSPEEAVIQKLLNIDPNTMTPVQALIFINTLKEALKNT